MLILIRSGYLVEDEAFTVLIRSGVIPLKLGKNVTRRSHPICRSLAGVSGDLFCTIATST